MEEIGSTCVHIKDNTGLSNSFSCKAPVSSSVSPTSKASYQIIARNGDSNENVIKTGGVGKSSIYPQFRIKYFSSEKERNRNDISSGFQFKTFEQVRSCHQISTGEYVQGAGFPPTTRLANKNRSFQCLFPFTDFKCPSPLLKTIFCRKVISNDVSTFRPRDCAKGICQSDELGGPNASRAGGEDYCIFRRFSDCKSIERNAPGTHQSGCSHFAEFRLGCEFPEINSKSTEVHRVFRNKMGPLAEPQRTPSEQVNQFERQNREDASRKGGVTKTGTEYSWFMEFCQFRGPERPLKRSSVIKIIPSNDSVPSQCDTDPFQCSSKFRMVASQSQNCLTNSFPASDLLLDHRCIRPRLGRAAQRGSFIRNMVGGRSIFSRQCFRNVGDNTCVTEKRGDYAELQPTSAERQPNCRCLPTQRGRHEVRVSSPSHISGIRRARSVPHSFNSVSHPRSLQLRSRSTVESRFDLGVASSEPLNLADLSYVGCAAGGPVCVAKGACSTVVRYIGHTGSEGSFRKRIQPQMGVHVSMDISPSLPNPEGVNSSEPSDRQVHNDCSTLGKSLLETRSPSSSAAVPVPDSQSRPSTDRHENVPPSTAGEPVTFRSVVDTGWSSLLAAWNKEQVELLDKSWRKSTLGSYKPAWLRWCKWARENNVSVYSPCPQDLARFLTDLFLKVNLSYSSICLHKSVVSTFCKPVSGDPLSSHVIVRQTLKGIALQQPLKRKPPVWDVNTLTSYLAARSVDSNSLFEVSKRTAIILLLCSGRRIHDLTLLNIDRDSLIIEDDSIVLWPAYGSKTDTKSYRQSGWRLLKCESNPNICPVRWIKKLLDCTLSRRGDINSLFISVCGSAKPASRSIIGGWIKRALQDAGIYCSPGSVRSAVASSSWLDNTPIDHILARGNWQSAITFHKYYKREVASTNTSRASHSLSNLFRAA